MTILIDTFSAEKHGNHFRADLIQGDAGNVYVDIFVNADFRDRFYVSEENQDDEGFIDAVVKSYFSKWMSHK